MDTIMTQHPTIDAPIDWLKPSIHPAYARLLCAHMLKQGADINALLQHTGLAWHDLKQQQHFISYEQFNHIHHNASRHSQPPCLALAIESMVQMSAHGILGHGALAAPTIAQSLALIKTALGTRIAFFDLHLSARQHELVITLGQRIELNHLAEFIYVMMCGSFLDLIETASTPDLSTITVDFPYSAPVYRDLYQHKFGNINIRFNSNEFSIIIPQSLMLESCLTADEHTFHHASHECRKLMLHQSNNRRLASQIILQLFEIARVTPVNLPTQQAMAQQHNIAVRTMIRRLKQEGTSYQALMDDVRGELARWYLQHSTLSIEMIAERLGFVDTSNFSRVFKRWHQETPSAFRQRYAFGNE